MINELVCLIVGVIVGWLYRGEKEHEKQEQGHVQ